MWFNSFPLSFLPFVFAQSKLWQESASLQNTLSITAYQNEFRILLIKPVEHFTLIKLKI